jgi:hypothetical protein
MKKLLYSLSIFLVAVWIFSGCKKVSIAEGTTAQSSVYFIYNTLLQTSDSTTVDFSVMDSSVHSDTVWMPVRITGSPASMDRPISLEADPAITNAIAGKHYLILPAIMPKDSFTTNVGVVIYKTADLSDTSLVLGLQIQANSAFTALMKDTVMPDGQNYSTNEYKITFSNELLEPADWNQWEIWFFGTYSKVKYEFIINATGVSQFPEDMDYGLLLYYVQEAQTALAAYNLKYGTLYDENGNPVTIP